MADMRPIGDVRAAGAEGYGAGTSEVLGFEDEWRRRYTTSSGSNRQRAAKVTDNVSGASGQTSRTSAGGDEDEFGYRDPLQQGERT